MGRSANTRTRSGFHVGTVAWRLGDKVHWKRSAVFRWSQHQENHLWRSSVIRNRQLVVVYPEINQATSMSCLFSGKLTYERDFKWKIAKFRYLCQVTNYLSHAYSALNCLTNNEECFFSDFRPTHSPAMLKFTFHAIHCSTTRSTK